MHWLIILTLLTTIPKDASSDGSTLVVLYSNPNSVLVIHGSGSESVFSINIGIPSQVFLKNGEVWVYDVGTRKVTVYTTEGVFLQEYQTPFQSGEIREFRFIGNTPFFLDKSGMLWSFNQGNWTSITLQESENPLDFFPMNDNILVLDRVHYGFFSTRMELKVYDMGGNLLESHQLPNSIKYGVDLFPVPSANQFLVLDEFNPKVFQVTQQGDSVYTFTFETSGGISIVSSGTGEIWVLNINSLSLIPVEGATKVAEQVTPVPLPLRVTTRPGQLEIWWDRGNIRLFDISGRRIFKQTQGMRHVKLTLNAGIYLLVYKDKDLEIKRKVIVLPKSLGKIQP